MSCGKITAAAQSGTAPCCLAVGHAGRCSPARASREPHVKSHLAQRLESALEEAAQARAQCRLLRAKIDALAPVQRAIDAVVKLKAGRPVSLTQTTLPHVNAKVIASTVMDEEGALSHLFEKAEDVCAAIDEGQLFSDVEEERALLLSALGLTELEWEVARHKYERAHV